MRYIYGTDLIRFSEDGYDKNSDLRRDSRPASRRRPRLRPGDRGPFPHPGGFHRPGPPEQPQRGRRGHRPRAGFRDARRSQADVHADHVFRPDPDELRAALDLVPPECRHLSQQGHDLERLHLPADPLRRQPPGLVELRLLEKQPALPELQSLLHGPPELRPDPALAQELRLDRQPEGDRHRPEQLRQLPQPVQDRPHGDRL